MTRLRSMAVSVLTTVIDVSLFALCTLLLVGMALPFARWVCGAIGAACNFLLNRRWVFGARGSGWSQAGRYGATALLSVTLGTLLWWVLWSLTGLDPRVLHVVSLALVWLAVTFPLLRRWVFAARTRQSAAL